LWAHERRDRLLLGQQPLGPAGPRHVRLLDCSGCGRDVLSKPWQHWAGIQIVTGLEVRTHRDAHRARAPRWPWM